MGHALFNLLMETECQPFHFCKVTTALFRRHDLADLAKVPQHGGLTLRAQLAYFGQLGFDRFLSGLTGSQRGLQFLFPDLNKGAVITAHTPVTIMQPPHPSHLVITEPVFHAQPLQIISGSGHVLHGPGCRNPMSDKKHGGSPQNHCQKDEQGPAHGSTDCVGSHGGKIACLGLFPGAIRGGHHASDPPHDQQERQTREGNAR